MTSQSFIVACGDVKMLGFGGVGPGCLWRLIQRMPHHSPGGFFILQGGKGMTRNLLLFALLMLVVSCAQQSLPPVPIQVPSRQINYLDEVKPILVKRCVVCHSCYNSPCQLKLSSYEGLDRGATKKRVYDAQRLQTMEPTRLFMDAHSSEEWQTTKGFFSVTKGDCTGGSSIMLQLLAAKNKTPMRNRDTYNAEADDLTCAENESELGNFLEKHPNRGMPFGFPPLTEKEFQLIGGWLAQGGVVRKESSCRNS